MENRYMPFDGCAKIFDTHAHYDDRAFASDGDSLINLMKNSGVCGIINCATNLKKSAPATAQLCKEHEFIYGAYGLHPLDIADEKELDEELLARYLSNEKAVAVGEIGLDYHYEKQTRGEQIAIFERQLQIANELNLPVIVHDREAHADTLMLLKEYNPRGVVHCFSGSVETAREILSLGMYIGLGGAVTFKNVVKPAQVAEYIPLDRLLLETDAPYMTPVPYRGKRCDSLHIPLTAQKIAQLKGVSANDVLAASLKNARELFGLHNI